MPDSDSPTPTAEIGEHGTIAPEILLPKNRDFFFEAKFEVFFMSQNLGVFDVTFVKNLIHA